MSRTGCTDSSLQAVHVVVVYHRSDLDNDIVFGLPIQQFVFNSRPP